MLAGSTRLPIRRSLFTIPFIDYIRNPNEKAQWSVGPPLMPGSLGNSGQDFLVLSKTQYFFLQQWQNNKHTPDPGPALGPGEYLDKVVLQNCLGGRFSPGIDLTFIVRQPDLYIKDWQTAAGPFRIKPAPLNYNGVQKGVPLLTEGYVPLHSGNTGVEPGDICKFMAIPWHTDYNSCATHPPIDNPPEGTTLFWSWPAQRPVAVYPAALNPSGTPTTQRWSVRGDGTCVAASAELGPLSGPHQYCAELASHRGRASGHRDRRRRFRRRRLSRSSEPVQG